MSERVLVINEEWCKGCKMCVWICPHNVLALSKDKINSMGYHPVEIANPDKCVQCRLCEYVCPDFAIFLVEAKELKVGVKLPVVGERK